jgi:hypothetical protein
MIKPIELTEQDKALMTQYDIKAETKTVFHAQGYKYDKLKDALSFARQSLELQHSADDV